VLAMLENQRDNLSKALPGLAKFELTQGETVSSGFYYNAYVPNVITPQLIQPFFDYASASGAAPMPASRRTTPGRARRFRSRTTAFRNPTNGGAAMKRRDSP
jgi:hypothetical protein